MSSRLEALKSVATASRLLLLLLPLVITRWPRANQASPLIAKLDCFNLMLCGHFLPNTSADLTGPAQGPPSGSRTRPLGGKQSARGATGGLLHARASPELCESCASAGEFPWYARLELQFKNETGAHVLAHCGATVIDRLFLLTSASCLKRPQLGTARRGLATVGLQNLLESAHRWQVRSIEAFCGRNFDPSKVYSDFSELWRPGEDVTVVKLNATLEYNDRVAPICLRDPDSLLAWDLDQALMAGFGIYDDRQRLPPARLSKHPMQACDESELAQVAFRRRSDQLCLIDSKRQGNPCEGDQGNGIYARLPSIRRMGLHSILSLPADLCRAGQAKPVLASELTSLKVQIKEMLAGC